MNFTEKYLWLLRHVLTGLAYPNTEETILPGPHMIYAPLNHTLRHEGEDWPVHGLTMIGIKRLHNLEAAFHYVNENGVDGDYVECGVWRGGASIYSTALNNLASKKVAGKPQKDGSLLKRKIWLLDSYSGFPLTNHEEDAEFGMWFMFNDIPSFIAVAQEFVEQSFHHLSFVPEQNGVQFWKGYFSESIPAVRQYIDRIAILRLDGDLYSSTMSELYGLYDKVSVGGWIIIDDWLIHQCRAAVFDFRHKYGIDDELVHIDGSSVYWIKGKPVELEINEWVDENVDGESVRWKRFAWNVVIAVCFAAVYKFIILPVNRKCDNSKNI